jgi:hypothetical protein
MTYDELIYELKRLKEIAWEVDLEIASELEQIINEHAPSVGDCCG